MVAGSASGRRRLQSLEDAAKSVRVALAEDAVTTYQREPLNGQAHESGPGTAADDFVETGNGNFPFATRTLVVKGDGESSDPINRLRAS